MMVTVSMGHVSLMWGMRPLYLNHDTALYCFLTCGEVLSQQQPSLC